MISYPALRLYASALVYGAAVNDLATHYYAGAIDTSSAPVLTDDFSPAEFYQLKAEQ